MKQAVVVASFGTTRPDTEERNITAVEQAMAKAFPGCLIRRAYTSGMVRDAIARTGRAVDDVSFALEALANQGVTEVVVQPTHLLHGIEYDKVCAAARQLSSRFERLAVGRPLLSSTDDLREVAQCLLKRFPTAPGQCLVLMGHGTDHFCNTVYGAMNDLFSDLGAPHVLVGTVEAYPDFDVVLRRIQAAGYRSARLAPLMLVAGEHAAEDMAGDSPKSWKSQLEAAGLVVEVCMEGLGENAAIRTLYCRHAAQALSPAVRV